MEPDLALVLLRLKLPVEFLSARMALVQPIALAWLPPTPTTRISDDARFTATDAVYPDRMQDIRGVLTGLYS